MTEPSVLTVILNFRTTDLTIRATAAALREMADLPGNVLVIDNASGDGSLRRIDAAITANGWNRDRDIALRQSGVNGGYGAGNNIGIRSGLMDGTRPDFIYILNSDATPDPGAIATLRDFLIATPRAGMAASHVRGEDGATHCTAFRFPSIAGEFEGAARTGLVTRLLRHAVVALPIPDQATQVDWSAGASLMLRREMLDQIGIFDEDFFLYFEETDLCRRAANAGWQVWYLPESRVVHVGSASTGMKGWQRTPGYWFDSRLRYFVKNHGRAYAFAATLAHVAGATLYRLRRLVSDKPQADPPHFLGDLVAHAIRAALPRAQAVRNKPAAVIEDAK
jgi:GT2 family glycosyltransferase